jgi:O-antigen chain-terminating methyltransferase
MSDGFTVEAIVAQIRSRIAGEKARESSPSRLPAGEGPSWDGMRCRRRMEEDTARFADLDLRLENAARRIGEQPFAPPTWRGRAGGWMVQGLRRLLWWYGLPIKESVAQIGLRNREQAIRHRYLREDLLAFGESLQTAVSRLDGLDQAQGDCRTQAGLSMERVESGFNDLRKSQDSAAEAAARGLREMREDWSHREGGTAQQITALNDQIQQLKAAYGVSESLRANLALRVEGLEARQESEAKAREALAGSLEKHAGRIHRFDEALGSLGERIGDAIGRAERLEHTTSALNLQLQAEALAREVLAGVVNGQADRLQQVAGAMEPLASLPGHVADLAATHEEHTGRIHQFDEALGSLGDRIGDAIGRAERVEHTASALNLQLQAEARTREVLAGVVNGQADKLQQVAGAVEPLAGLPGRVSSLAVTHEKQRSALLLQENRIGRFLREVRHQLPEPLSKAQVQQFTEAPADALDALYAEFEDTFRGPRELIKERQEVYVPRLIQARAGSISAPVLDLGCGRGEWLELLADRNLVASGVDSNPGMIERCRALGIHATLGEALTHLRGLPDRSVGAVTSFHMVEHLPFETVIALLDEALRVLRTGGVLILETPNPQNVLVGSQTFWIDPTHLKPIPSQTLRFFVEARGFCEAEVWNLQPYPEAIRLPEDAAGMGARFNDYFYGPQDYGIIARRP